MKHYPKRLKVGKRHYKLKLAAKIIGEPALRGYCAPDSATIVLLSKQSSADLFSTFWHEVLHAIEAEYKIKLPHKTVYALEGPIAQVLKSNFNLRLKRS